MLWEKPFQNMRSSRATELIAIYPAHVVNAIMGHTEAVAMAHYRQVLDSDFEKLSAMKTAKCADSDAVDKNGTRNTGTCPSKKCADSDDEPAILGLNRLETENSEIDVTSTVSSGCNEMQDMSEHTFFAQLAGAGLEPATLRL